MLKEVLYAVTGMVTDMTNFKNYNEGIKNKVECYWLKVDIKINVMEQTDQK